MATQYPYMGTRQTCSKYLRELERLGVMLGQKIGREVYFHSSVAVRVADELSATDQLLNLYTLKLKQFFNTFKLNVLFKNMSAQQAGTR